MEHLSPLRAWESFYVIVGSSAAALTGLQFVVMALVADTRPSSTGLEIAAFGTPTVVHFCVVLMVSAILSAPWPALSGTAVAIGLSGLAGLAYAAIVVRRARRQMAYEPVLEDWIWHAVLPLIAYVTVLAAAFLLPHHSTESLFAVAGSALLLLFIGIHNAWDTVTFVVVDRPKDETRQAEP